MLLIACRTSSDFSLTEKSGRLEYTDARTGISLLLYGDYSCSRRPIKALRDLEPAIKEILSHKHIKQQGLFLVASTTLSPWIHYLGTSYPATNFPTIDSMVIYELLPEHITDAHLTPFHSDINGSESMHARYAHQGYSFSDYFSIINQQLIRLTFAGPDSTANNLYQESAAIYQTLNCKK